MFNRLFFAALLFISLSGCAVYDYDRGYHNGHAYRYYDGYRRDYHAPPVYVTPRYYYEDRRHRYSPAPPSYYGYDQRHRDGYKRYDKPRHDHRRDHRRQEHRGGQIPHGWDAGRNKQQRFSSGRSHNEQHRSGARRW